MNITDLGKGLQHFVVHNSPAIMSAMAVTGVFSTTVLAVRATPEALGNVEYERHRRQTEWAKQPRDNKYTAVEKSLANELSLLDYVKVTWRAYIPAAAVGLSTISLIVGAQAVNTRRNAALMSVYSLTENAFNDYKGNVIEVLGEKKDQLINDNIAKKRVENNPPNDADILVDDDDKILCYESLSGRYFKSDKETIRKAQNDINKVLIDNVYVSLNDFYDMLGLSSNALGEEVGWRSDQVMDIIFSAVLTPTGAPCLSIDYRVGPIHGYYKGF